MREKQGQCASAQVTEASREGNFQILAEKNCETDKVPEASELWQNQRFYISYIILYNLYLFYFFLYFTMEKFKCMQNAKTNIVYPWPI